MWLKKCARHAHFHFELPKGMAVFLSELCPSNLVESWKLISTTTGENLVSISQTTFEWFKINQNLSFTVDNQSYILDIQRCKMYDWLSRGANKFCLILNYLKVVWGIDTKFSPVVVLMSFQLSTKFGVLAWLKMDFPPKLFQTSRGRGGHIFWATPMKLRKFVAF